MILYVFCGGDELEVNCLGIGGCRRLLDQLYDDESRREAKVGAEFRLG